MLMLAKKLKKFKSFKNNFKSSKSSKSSKSLKNPKVQKVDISGCECQPKSLKIQKNEKEDPKASQKAFSRDLG